MEAPKNKPVDTEKQPPLIPPEPESPTRPTDPETLKRLGDENQAELRKQREEEAEKRGHWSDV